MTSDAGVMLLSATDRKLGLINAAARCISDPRNPLLIILWIQLSIGLATLPLSLHHSDGGVMMALGEWAQRLVTFRPGGAEFLVNLDWPYKVHLVLGMTIFFLFPFSRLVHVWSGFGSLAYLIRPYQIVRARRMNVPEGHNQPRRPGASV